MKQPLVSIIMRNIITVMTCCICNINDIKLWNDIITIILGQNSISTTNEYKNVFLNTNILRVLAFRQAYTDIYMYTIMLEMAEEDEEYMLIKLYENGFIKYSDLELIIDANIQYQKS